jgi:hypothetical protein
MRRFCRSGVGVALGLAATASIWCAPSTASGVCTGDCDGNGTVTIEELITAVNIALGLLPLSACPAADGGGDGQVTIDDLISAVDNALNGCAATPTATPTNQLLVTGGCAKPGAHGLVACDEGVLVVVWRCDTPATCLAQLAARTRLGDGPVGNRGGFAIRVDAVAAARAELLFEAPVAGATLYRTMGLGPASGGAARLGAVAGQSLELSVGMIDPGSEAGVRLLDEHGLENFVPDGLSAVVGAAQTANAETVFDGLGAEEAAAKALAVAEADPAVQQVITTFLVTPTPTATPTGTATASATPTASQTRTATRTNTPIVTSTGTPPSTATATRTPSATPTASRTSTATPSATPTKTPTSFFIAQITTDRGCLETDGAALYNIGDPVTVTIRIDGSNGGMPIQQAHVTFFEEVDMNIVRGPSEDDVPTGQNLEMQLNTIPPVAVHRFFLQASALAGAFSSETLCSVQVAAASCATACDCTPGQSCVGGTCMQLGNSVYCCTSTTCPLGATCQFPAGGFGMCAG